MFRGRYIHIMDQKGRVSLPAPYRETLQKMGQNVLVITSLHNCLWAYPLSVWEEVEKRVSTLPPLRSSTVAFQRLFVSGAKDCVIDRLGRIIVPQSLREYAKLEKEVVFLGIVNRIEIWNKDLWSSKLSEYEASLEEFPEELSDIKL